jgi:hypothetical protein
MDKTTTTPEKVGIRIRTKLRCAASSLSNSMTEVMRLCKKRGLTAYRSRFDAGALHSLVSDKMERTRLLMPGKTYEHGRDRTCNLLIRSQAPCHWATHPVDIGNAAGIEHESVTNGSSQFLRMQWKQRKHIHCQSARLKCHVRRTQSLDSIVIGLCTDGPRYARGRTRNQYCHLARRISFAICLQISEHDIELSIVIRSHDDILEL